ncbi:hypothetical protein TruAng_009218 [Truncatella angustata]|nr:hypothetical protein TruAng_009218 [Truncatella angustata]
MASSGPQKDEKSKLDEKSLRQNGIDYFIKWETMGPAPNHISTLCETLTDISCALSARFVDDCTGRMVIRTDLEEFREDIEKRLERYRSIAKAAERLHGNQSDENGWRNHYKTNFLEPLHRRHELGRHDSRLREDIMWTLFHREGPYHERRQNLKYPKPDWVAHFPICDLENPTASGFAQKPLWDWSSSKNGKMVHEFDGQDLQRLTDFGLQCHVARALQGKKNAGNMDPDKMFSFPWFIVEFKRTRGEAKYCYCQVANGAACTLLMFETLSRYADKEHEQAQIPPIITMTAVGKDVKLWIGYAGPDEEPRAAGAKKSDKDPNWFHSRCFWTGDMTKVKDAMDLEALLENVYTWAMRVLRPRIVQYLKQWRTQMERNTHTPLPRPRPKKGDDVLEYVRYGFEETDARLRNIMVAFQDDTLEKMREMLSDHLASVKSLIQKDA